MTTLKSTFRKIGDRYQVSCLWKDDHADNITNNFHLALKRMQALQHSRKRSWDKVYADLNKVFSDYEAQGFIRRISTTAKYDKNSYFWPYFAVYREDKATTKCRPVFDGKAKCLHNGKKSINDYICPGPPLINNLVNVLIRFRMYDVAVAADVTKMFLQVLLRPEDRPYHRFLWLDNSGELVIYEFTRHLFGNTGSPTCAIYVIMQVATDHKKDLPLAADIVLNSSLVDDIITSLPSVEEAKTAVTELGKLFDDCGMTLSKYLSNKPEVLNDVPNHNKADSTQLTINDEAGDCPTAKALGQVWRISEDVFTFCYHSTNIPEKVTMRKILSETAKHYDPLGFTVPLQVKARILLQSCWALNLKWDDPVPPDIRQQFLKWCDDLRHINKLAMPRVLIPGNATDLSAVQLHVFADASQNAFAAVSYVVTPTNTMEKRSILLMSRAKVTPLSSTFSIPKLELLGCELASLIAQQVNEVLQLPNENIYLWTDSSCCLAWLQLDAKNLMVFVANRTTKIRRRISINNIAHVPTDANPADIPTRAIPAKDFVDNPLWLYGPTFLSRPKDEWPTPKQPMTSAQVLQETKKDFRDVVDINAVIPDFSRYRDVTFLTLADAVKFGNQENADAYIKLRDKLVDPTSIVQAVQAAQVTMFSRTLEEIQKLGHVSRSNPLRQLNPGLDQQGLLRVQGRLRQADRLTFAEKQPILLRASHPLSNTIFRHYHDTVLDHMGGPQLLMTEISKRYWIVKGNRHAKALCRKCPTCKAQNATATHSNQVMAPLPNSRIPQGQRLRPFSSIILDCAGPFITTVLRKTRGAAEQKRWVLVLTCSIYRAVHLEILYDMSATAFLDAFMCFTARRGWPKSVHSDRGTNLIRAAKDIDATIGNIDKEEVVRKLRLRLPSVDFSFGVPHAPHQQGAVEAIVKLVKQGLAKSIPSDQVRDNELYTVLVRIEGLLNSRPIAYKCDITSDDYIPLTANSFLQAVPDDELPPVFEPEVNSYGKRFHIMSRILDSFWKNFCALMQSKLHHFHKWDFQRRDLHVGDVCILLEDKHRGLFPLVKIDSIKKSLDGHVRNVIIRLGDHTYERPITKLVLVKKWDDPCDTYICDKTPATTHTYH